MHGQRSPDGCGSENASKPCRGPWAPDASGTCASMMSCATATSAPAAVAAMDEALPTTRDLPEPLSAESDLAVAPEPPPPRL
jgi:hypothetical protein